MKLERIPPIIIATDFSDIESSLEIVDKMIGFDETQVGFKVPHWHDQNKELIRQMKAQGKYVVLDTHLRDGADKMSIAVRSYLEDTPDDEIPDAITINPFSSISSTETPGIREHVVEFVHNRGVAIVGFSEQTDNQTGTDDHAITSEATRLLNACDAELDGFEVHAENFISSKFLQELNLAVQAKSRKNFEMSYRNFRTEDWPDIIASKFDLSTRVVGPSLSGSAYNTKLRNIPPAPEGIKGFKTPEQELKWLERITLAAGYIFGLGVSAIYIGGPVIRNSRPISVVQRILDLREEAIELPADEVIKKINDSRTIVESS